MASITKGNDLMGIRILIVAVVFTVLAVAAVVGRFWARRIKRQQIDASDYFILIALFFTICLNITPAVAAIEGAVGRHQLESTPAQTIILAKAFIAAGVLWAVSIAFVKISVLFFYLRLFRNPVFQKLAFLLMGLSISLATAVILGTLLICRPLAYNWNRTIDGTCGNTQKLYLSGGIVNLLLDVAIVTLPMPMLWNLQLKVSKKIALTFVLGLGAFVCVISVLRIVSISELDLLDFTYTSSLDGIWSILEPSLGITAASLPIMQPLLSKMNALKSTLFSKTGGNTQRSLRASSKKIGNQQERKKDAEDLLYPLSNIVGTVNEFDVNLSRSESDTYDDYQGEGQGISVKRAFDVTSDRRV